MQVNRSFSLLIAGFFALLMQLPAVSLADGLGRVRAGADFGYGYANVSVSGSDRSEGPGTFSVMLEYSMTSSLVFGVEHYRTLVDDDGPSSGVGFSGIYGKYFFYNIRPQVLPVDNSISHDEYIVKAFSPYVGASVGIGQSSLRSLDASQAENRSLSVGAFVAGKMGIEYPIYQRYTLFTELNLAATIVGTGTIFFPRVGVGFFASF